jgi:hypothetical protein
MAQVVTKATRQIDATPDAVFDAIADYRETRPAILPPQFENYEVRAGGQGAGTTVHWLLRATSKRTRDCLIDVSAEGARQLVEHDANSSMVTTWTVTPVGTAASRVDVETTWQGAGGVAGFFERTFAPLGLRRIYDDLLGRLALRLAS